MCMAEIQEVITPETDASTPTGNDLERAYKEARSRVDAFHRTLAPLGFLSSAEINSQREYIYGAEGDAEKMTDIIQSYSRSMVESSIRTNLDIYRNQVKGPLNRAVAEGIISQRSHDEWLTWLSDPGRSSMDKKASIRDVLPGYLASRRELARSRYALLQDPRLSQLATKADSTMRERIATLKSDHTFLNTLDVAGRKKLIIDIQAELPILEKEQAIFASFQKQLAAAVSDGLIAASSQTKWIARFNDPKVSSAAKIYFVENQFPSYVKSWTKVRDERATLLKDPLLKELKSTDVKQLDTFTKEAQFLTLHYNDKTNLVAAVRAALAAKKTGKEALHKEASGILAGAAGAGYISKTKVGPWLEHILSGARSVAELKNYVKDWAKIRYRYDQTEQQMNFGKVPQGFTRLTPESFLELSYAQRVSYVEEAEKRVQTETTTSKEMPNPKMKDIKGKIRHSLDTEDWEGAKYYLSQAWAMSPSEEDQAELHSMNRYLTSFGKEQQPETNDAGDEVRQAFETINQQLALLPPVMRKMYERALVKGVDCLQCVTTCVYNRTWCHDHGYLNPALENRLRAQSVKETEERLKVGGENRRNQINNSHVDSGHQPAVHDDPIAPQNEFIGGGGVDSFVEKAAANSGNHNFWYWTNAIVQGVSGDENNTISRNVNWKIKSAARNLQAKGFRWNPSGPPVAVN